MKSLNEPKSLREYLRQDLKANTGRVHIQFLLVLLRLSQWSRSRGMLARPLALGSSAAYRFLALFAFGIDIPVSTRLGSGLSIHHGMGLVIHNAAIVGQNCVLRQNVTIGARRSGGGAPNIGNDVEFGAGALVLGEITVGAGARIGAGSVVIGDVPDNGVVVGNPARLISLNREKQ
ncbi:serine O-acetyltransferase [Arthrobacter sp. M-10]|uniref:serine O-acetyltransferase n=1 Tax=Arthrobacter sp. M-10 TaxID=3233037 RepID=UPI003F910625